MIDDLKAMAIFVETIKQGSFKAASRELGLSPSVVSYHVAQLEGRIGNALLYRSTRKLSLTSEGEILFEHAEAMLEAAKQGLSLVSSEHGAFVGSLKVTVPSSLTRGLIATKLAAFKRAYGDIALDIDYTDQWQDLIAAGIDIAIRVGPLPDSTLKSCSVGNISRTLVCAASFYNRQKPPISPVDLAGWQWIGHSRVPNRRSFECEAEHVEVSYASSMTVNNVDAMTQMAVEGMGLATPPSMFVASLLAKGDLIEVLPEWTVRPVPIYAVWPNNVSSASNARLLLDCLLENETFRGA